MSLEACIKKAMTAAGRTIEEKDMVDLRKVLNKRISEVRAVTKGDELDEVVLKAVEGFATENVAAAIIEKRTAALNLRVRLRAESFVKQFPDNPELAIQALDVGIAQDMQGGRFAASVQQEGLMNHYQGGMVADIEKAGLMKLFISGEMDREIWRAMSHLNDPEPDVKGLPKESVKLAEILNKWNEAARVDANNAGAWIQKLPGWVVKQTHEMSKIRKAGFPTWKKFVTEKLDMERTFADVEDIDQALLEIYNGLATGVHLKAPSAAPTGLKGFGSVGKRMSHQRVLHFKDADAGFDYQMEFGAGNLREGMLHGLERMGQNTGLMRAWGPNPEANRTQIMDGIEAALKKGEDTEALAKFHNKREALDNNFKQITGETRIPGNQILAQVSHTIRAVQSMSKLGKAVLSAVADIPLYASEMRYQGRDMFSGMAEAVSGLFHGKTSAEEADLLASLGVFLDSMRGSVAGRYSAHDTMPGMVSKVTQTYFKYNGLQWWTDQLRRTAAMSMSHRLAINAGKSLDEIDPDLKRVLGLFGIDDTRWNVLRSASKRAVDGRDYMTPEAIRDLPDEAFTGLYSGKKSPTKIRRAKEELEAQLRGYYADRADFAVILPDARTRALMVRGTKPGTVEGELFRFVGQFKQFPVAVLQKSVAREIYGRGQQTTLAKALRNGNGEMQGLAQLMVWNTLFGYAAMSLKDLSKLKEPRPVTNPKTWMAAALQGGALGIYGDFLFGEMRNRYGGGPLASFLGPTAGTFADISDLLGRVREGDPVAGRAFRTLLNNTPFINMFYSRAALDYLFAYQVSESLSPGYLRRLESRTNKEMEQKYIVPPSAALR